VAHWQSQHSSGYRESAAIECDQLTGIDKLLGDAMTHALIRRAVTGEQYLTLVLRYSGDEAARIYALKALMSVIKSPAGPATLALAIGAWAGYRSQSPSGTDFDAKAIAPSTVRGYRMQIRKALNALHDEAMTRVSRAMTEGGLIGA
jgi:hypothetical protein